MVFGLITAYGASTSWTPKPRAEPVVEEAPRLPPPPCGPANLTPYSRINRQRRDAGHVSVQGLDGRVDSRRIRSRTHCQTPNGPWDDSSRRRSWPGSRFARATFFRRDCPADGRRFAHRISGREREGDDAIASNGAILPGSFVDVELTFDSDHPDVNGTATMNLFRRLKVLTPMPQRKS